jgi:hypothetical protein
VNEVTHLVLSSTIDYSSDLICAELEKRGLSYLRLNRDRFSEYEIEYILQDDVMNLTLGGIHYSLYTRSLKSVYYRAPVFLRTTGKAHTVEEQLKRSQWSAFLRNLIIFDRATWINHPVSIYRAENKLYQLKTAKQCGMTVPETYVGNSLPHSIIPDNMYIAKSLDTALFYKDGNEMFTYSTMISGQELQCAEIKSAPIIIQEYLCDKTDIRVTFIGNRVFPVSITKNGKALIGDWRKSNKDNLEYIPIELPQILIEQLITLMNCLDLTFGGIDLAIVDDTYYFIEVNPTGEWGWLTSSSKIPIDKAIVDYMVTGGVYDSYGKKDI